MEIDNNSLIKNIYKKDRLVRYLWFIVGVLIISFSFNVFILPNDIVYGVSGVGVILYRMFGITPSITIMVGSLILLILSYFTLGWDKTKNSVIGSIIYPICVSLTAPLAQYIDLGNLETIVMILFGAVLNGVGSGLVFKSGFTTGGTDVLNQIFSKYFKMSIGNAILFTDGVIIVSSLFVFGWTKFIYSIINMYIISVMTDKVILGISNSKAFYIITEHETSIKKFLLNGLSHGVTVLEGRGGYTGNNQKVIMCIVPTKEYFVVKEGIHEIDPEAFFLVTDSYEVYGGE